MKKTRTIPFRRKREGKTNYKSRIRLLLSKKPRLVIRKTLKNITAQIIEFDPKGDRILAAASSKELRKKGWKVHGGNLVTGYLVGLSLANKIKGKVGDLVLDLGLQTAAKGCNLYGVLKGVIDGGLKVPHSPDILPDENRVKGKHIAEYAKKIKEDKAKYEKQFSQMIKEGIDPEKIETYFEDMKKNVGA
ncbi:MAG: 50S ribosomal protein L18 [Nanoarchaeota archaeon]|nr:50S ribosomal protein L18 [Nanoarchaeota archaeon]